MSRERYLRLLREAAIVALVLLCTFAARSALADHYYVPSGSMERSLMSGDRVVVDKLTYGLRVPFTGIEITEGRPPERGEVVVFDSPESGKRLIKRVVAVGGDQVTVRNGHVSIDGRSLTAPDDPDTEIHGDRRVELELDDGGGPDVRSFDVPEGHVMVMGDNRGNSRDSRFFGAIPVDRIYGRAFRIYYRRGDGLVWRPL